MQPIRYSIAKHFTSPQAAAVCTANIYGVIGQWHPTGLVRGELLPINPLPNVDRYLAPFDSEAGCRSKVRMIDAFDAAAVIWRMGLAPTLGSQHVVYRKPLKGMTAGAGLREL